MDTALCDPLPTPAEMAAWDRACVKELGLHPHVLMERASLEALAALAGETGPPDGKRVVVLAGPGQNGGDALALARHLFLAGARPEILLLRPRSRSRASAGYNLRLCVRLGLPMRALTPASLARALDRADIVVDGLLGTGFSGALKGDVLAVVETLNARAGRAFVLALDIPSGLCGLTGRPSPAAVRAGATVTFEAPKTGLITAEAQAFVGRLRVRPIGVPERVKTAHPVERHLLTARLAALLPRPEPGLHKGRAGRVLVIGGSRGLCGAPHLAALAALRAGAGLVTAACPGGLEALVKSGSPDIMTLPLGKGETLTPAEAPALRRAMEQADAVVLGPGLGRDPATAELLGRLAEIPVPAVWDADALYVLARDPDLRARLGPNAVLTPHPGEAARLLDSDAARVQADRVRAARTMARETGAVCLLKGPASLTAPADPDDGRLFVSPFIEPNLAVGGSGDVLSGLLGACLAGGMAPLPAACLAVYWHGLAGRILATTYPGRGNLASDIAGALPLARKEFVHADRP